ncbi:alanine racemase [Dasania sp. GY-MA-18]|uniref:Alanine racemase n=1 Tax=Dasania phycosphaerae TaxID=2950436 RepID=A0A9J6RNG1_9GAMM|nr:MULTISPECIES: alanine racemase [Dasania]MCR8923633.1 alanine racemase [Dasania sp. GY-MA-18]MCZ0866067.1 alanine racemase [Dasania phycosphaerae]MCZ0869791.1 alanine racemase [Dasania phycosphaerae]
MARPAKAEINLDALRHNYRLACKVAPDSQAVAIVKANAYGHGAVAAAQALQAEAPVFGVACIEEAMELREAGIQQPILLLEGMFSAEELAVARQQGFWVAVGHRQQIEMITQAASGQALKVWLKLDTGMHRLGVQPGAAVELYRLLAESDNVADGIVLMSHLACGDEIERPQTPKQIQCFADTLAAISAVADELGQRVETSLANSAGTMAWQDCRRSWNRPGYMLYGGNPFGHSQENADQLQPVMNLRTAVIALRDIAIGECVGYGASWCAQRPSKIATIAMGYADGYPRVVKPGTPVLIHGQRASIVGRVSMDMITIDVTDLADVQLGDEVLMWGEGLSVDEIADCAGTIGYELLARMPARVPRVYLGK